MRMVLTGGGTGGHLAIVKALKEEATKRGHSVIYMGSTNGQDRAWFEDDRGFETTYFFETSGVVNKKGLKKVWAMGKVVKAFFRAYRLLKRERIEAVVSVGGYSAAPASAAAIARKIPFYIHEQNAAMGRLNTILQKYATRLFSSYHEPKMDYPVQSHFFAKARQRDTVRTIIFLGGSQGAQFINEWALELAPMLDEKGIRIIHQCGERHIETMQAAYDALGIQNVELFGFSKALIEFLDKADVAVARAGAGTVWELTALQLPAIFVPYPYAANDHQTANAKVHVEMKASWMMQQTQKDNALVTSIIDTGVKVQSEALQHLLHRGGASSMVKIITKETV